MFEKGKGRAALLYGCAQNWRAMIWDVCVQGKVKIGQQGVMCMSSFIRVRDEQSAKLTGCDGRTRVGHVEIVVAAAVIVVVAHAGRSPSVVVYGL